MVVITMMLFITTITVMSYHSAMRTASANAASNSIFNLLQTARQHACIDNKPVYLYLLSTTNCVLVQPIGTYTPPPGLNPDFKTFIDLMSDPATMVSVKNLLIMNLGSSPGTTTTVTGVTSTLYATNNLVDINGWVVGTVHISNVCQVSCSSPITWQNGDPYGTMLFTPLVLPKGFVFFPPPTPPCIAATFNADGTTIIPSTSLIIQETIPNGAPRKFQFTTDGSGIIQKELP